MVKIISSLTKVFYDGQEKITRKEKFEVQDTSFKKVFLQTKDFER